MVSAALVTLVAISRAFAIGNDCSFKIFALEKKSVDFFAVALDFSAVEFYGNH